MNRGFSIVIASSNTQLFCFLCRWKGEFLYSGLTSLAYHWAFVLRKITLQCFTNTSVDTGNEIDVFTSIYCVIDMYIR